MDSLQGLIDLVHPDEEDRKRARVLLGGDRSKLERADWEWLLPLGVAVNSSGQALDMICGYVMDIFFPDPEPVFLHWFLHWLSQCPEASEDREHLLFVASLQIKMGRRGEAVRYLQTALAQYNDTRDPDDVRFQIMELLFWLYGEEGHHAASKAMLDGTASDDPLASFILCWRYILALKEGDDDTARGLEDDVVMLCERPFR